MRASRGAIAASIVLGLLGTLAWRNVVDWDFGIHMGSGRWIVDHGSVPDTDPFTWTASERPYLAYHWLYQATLYLLHRDVGIAGIALLRWLLLVGAGALVADVLRMRRSSALAGAFVGTAAILASEWRFMMRPELVSNLLLAATLWVCERHRLGRPGLLWLLVPIQVLWVNTHVFALGWGVMLVYVVRDAYRARGLRTPLVAWAGASAVALLLNPYHVHALVHPLALLTRVLEGNVFAAHIGEYAPPDLWTWDPSSPFSIGLGFNAHRLLVGMAAVVLLPLAYLRRWIDVALVAIYGALSLVALRNVALFAIVATPALCTALDAIASAARRRPDRSRDWLGSVALAAVLGFALLTTLRVVNGTYYAEARRQNRFEASVCRSCLALDAADWVASSSLAGPGFNNLVMGSTLLWRDPERRIFIDGRNEVTGEALFARYLAARDPERWRETQAAWGFEYAVLAHGDFTRARELGSAIARDPDWKLVFADGAAVVLVRASGPNGGAPSLALPERVGPAERGKRLQAVATPEGRVARVGAWLASPQPPPGERSRFGALLMSIGDLERAERPMLEAMERSPRFYEVHADLGSLYARRGMRRAAGVASRRALALAPGRPDLGAAGDALSR